MFIKERRLHEEADDDEMSLLRATGSERAKIRVS